MRIMRTPVRSRCRDAGGRAVGPPSDDTRLAFWTLPLEAKAFEILY
ncbi:MAG TPA: hypothetical protein VF192_05430 [Longimicrobiales bacterium]